MWERMIFTSVEEMEVILRRLLLDFPNSTVSNSGTEECPWQATINLGLVDRESFLGWAITSRNLVFCSYLVLDMLEEPQPDWMRPVLLQFGNHLLE
jgi:hypothetical protein